VGRADGEVVPAVAVEVARRGERGASGLGPHPVDGGGRGGRQAAGGAVVDLDPARAAAEAHPEQRDVAVAVPVDVFERRHDGPELGVEWAVDHGGRDPEHACGPGELVGAAGAAAHAGRTDHEVVEAVAVQVGGAPAQVPEQVPRVDKGVVEIPAAEPGYTTTWPVLLVAVGSPTARSS
jgi:hypothetical protein